MFDGAYIPAYSFVMAMMSKEETSKVSAELDELGATEITKSQIIGVLNVIEKHKASMAWGMVPKQGASILLGGNLLAEVLHPLPQKEAEDLLAWATAQIKRRGEELKAQNGEPAD